MANNNKITYEDKENLVDLPDVNLVNKVTAEDMNEIKDVVNQNRNEYEDLKKYTELTNVQMGGIIAYFSNYSNIPANFLPLDGRALSRTEYADLFSIIGTTYGTGDGKTTFNLPNQNANKSNIPTETLNKILPTYYYIMRVK